MEVPFLVILKRMAFDSPFLDESGDIIIRPFKDGKVYPCLLLTWIGAAEFRLLIPFGPLGGLAPAYSLDGPVIYLVFLQGGTTMAAAVVAGVRGLRPTARRFVSGG